VLAGAEHPAQARRVPRTLAHQAEVGAQPVDPGFPIDFVGVQWDGEPGPAAVRFQHDGRWGAWTPLIEDGAEVDGQFASGLVAGDDADAYQVRVPPGTSRPRAVAINTTDGPRVPVEHRPASSAEAAAPLLTRSDWGADERLRFDVNNKEIWPPTYHRAQKMTVHHTATRNADPDPAATMRAIYRYHAVDRGWGDIGYQYLIDEAGRVYEGRWSGADGDPGHDAGGGVVTAAHVGGYNSGNLGISLLGTLTSQGPTGAARTTLEDVLAQLAARHVIDPEGTGRYVNPVNGATWDGPHVSGHRDWEATECPGGALYALLPSIRANAAALNSGTTTTTTPTTVAPATTAAPTTTTTKPPKPKRRR
jgi:hypothetical protein